MSEPDNEDRIKPDEALRKYNELEKLYLSGKNNSSFTNKRSTLKRKRTVRRR